jgi:uncharacterized protein (DUF1697 family)
MSKARAVVSMLRGVNLAGHNRISMESLRGIYESLGLRNPRTYVQSGNVVFRSDAADLARLASRIEKAVERTAGFRTPVILRTTAEMRDVVRRNPIADRSEVHAARFLVTFLASMPSPEAVVKARTLKSDTEEVWIDGREVYMYFANGLARPKLSWTTVEKALGVSGTGRNWNSVLKLLAMAEEMEASA